MDRWTKADPPLALPGHIHLSDDGSRRVGQAIYDALMADYEGYLQQAPAIVSGGG
jgi:hypothetical protein